MFLKNLPILPFGEDCPSVSICSLKSSAIFSSKTNSSACSVDNFSNPNASLVLFISRISLSVGIPYNFLACAYNAFL